MKKAFARARKMWRKFSSARGGNVAITFALATLPIVGTVGAAVDYSHANQVKAAMQGALDSTALMLAKDAATVSNTQLQTNATNYFNALFTRPEAKNVVIAATYTATGGSKVVVNGSVDVPTAFVGIIGVNNITVNGSSTTSWGSARLRVALVLDNTGSMADDGKMTALISATNSLLTQLKNAASTDGDVYVSIIPFVKDVNAGASNYTANWIDWTDWDAKNGQYCKSNGHCSNWQSGNAVWTPDNHSTWNGCVTDRGNSSAPSTGNYDTNVVAPNTTITATLYAAEQYTPCPQAIMPLSYNWSGMTTLVNNMAPGGNTNQAIGLQMGWMSLVGGGPFPTPPAMDPNYTYTQVIILLTDGLNTQDRWYTSQSSIDARQTLTCNNIKTSGVTLYTIQVNTGGDPTSTLLESCAGGPDKFSDPSKFYIVTSASGIAAVFSSIGTNLTKLRIAK